MTPTREVYWQIQGIWLMYVLLLPTLAIFAFGLYRRYRTWVTLGKPVNRFDNVPARLRRVFVDVLRHQRLLRDGVAGWMHIAISGAMLLLFIGTTVVAVHEDLRIPIMQGWFYLVFQKLALNLAGMFLAVGCAVALIRRYLLLIPRLQHNRKGVRRDPTDAASLWWLLLLMLQGFALSALRLAAKPDPHELWSPFAYLFSLPLRGLSLPALIVSYQFTWWSHLLTTFAWIAWLPYGKMLHIFTSPFNVYTSNLHRGGVAEPQPIDFETAERLGMSALGDMTWKDLADLDACTACGRCQDVCPAYASGLPLSPKNLILDLRDHMNRVSAGTTLDEGMVGVVIKEETLWACTTCGACMQECPVYVEHVPKIVDMRRHLVMEQASMPAGLADALKSLEDRSHPYRGANATRTDWCEGLDVPMAADKGEVEVLYWVGCTASFDARNQKVARAFVTLLKEAGVEYAILGKEESCTGDPARRMGNEFLYETIARGNIETLLRYKPKKIVTACPHCFNALGKEYRAFGGQFEVVHHTQLLKDLVDSGRLTVGAGLPQSVTYHDPCYLGRYSGEYDAPRDLVELTGELIEMERNKSKSFCCGAGGAGAWVEHEGEGPRINQIRSQEAVATGAETVAVACPFCMQMMEDGIKTVNGDDGPRVRDIAELILEAIQ